jgi:poly(hydroxyalkanoate) granule-associated protein
MVKKIHSSSSDEATTKAGKGSKTSAAGKAGKAAGGLQGSQLANSVKDSAHQIWLAGMGAFSKAQEEGTKVFEALVREGQTLQRKTQAVAEEKIGEVTGKMTAMAGSVTNKAGQNWDKLETIFEARTAKAMNKLGVPTAKDVDALVKRVDELAAAVAKLSKRTPAKPAVKAAAKPAAKSSKAAKAAKAAVADAAAAVEAVVAKAPAKRAPRKAAVAA